MRTDRYTSRCNPRVAEGNESEARELELWIDNTASLYRMKRAAEESLLRKIASGRYDPDLAPKAFAYVAEEGAKHYRKEFRMTPGNGFAPATRRLVATAFAREFEGEHEGELAAMRAGPSRRPSRPARSAPVTPSGSSSDDLRAWAEAGGDRVPNAPFYAVATDAFMSGSGPLGDWFRGGAWTNLYVIPAPDYETARVALANLKARGEMKRPRIVNTKPRHRAGLVISVAKAGHRFFEPGAFKPEARTRRRAR